MQNSSFNPSEPDALERYEAAMDKLNLALEKMISYSSWYQLLRHFSDMQKEKS